MSDVNHHDILFDSFGIRWTLGSNGILKSLLHKSSGREWLDVDCNLLEPEVLGKKYTNFTVSSMDVLELRFFALENRWPQASRGWKSRIRKNIDFSQYQ